MINVDRWTKKIWLDHWYRRARLEAKVWTPDGWFYKTVLKEIGCREHLRSCSLTCLQFGSNKLLFKKKKKLVILYQDITVKFFWFIHLYVCMCVHVYVYASITEEDYTVQLHNQLLHLSTNISWGFFTTNKCICTSFLMTIHYVVVCMLHHFNF